jgi:hypothetical protein
VADALEAFEPGTENLKKQALMIRMAIAEGGEAVCWSQGGLDWSVRNRKVTRCLDALIKRQGQVITHELAHEVIDEVSNGEPYRWYNVNKDEGHWYIVPRVR